MTAGYLGTPLAQKLGVKEGHRLTLLHPPAGWTVPDLPANVDVVRRRSSVLSNVVVAFFADLATLDQEVEGLSRCIVVDGSLWIAWPRRARGHTSELTDNNIRATALPLGLVDVKVAALDDDWSGLKVVWRKGLRAAKR